jgi:hypothetical protein
MRLFGRGSTEKARYAELGVAHVATARAQAGARGIDVQSEPLNIMRAFPLPGKVDGEHYWAHADYLLAEYPTELGVLVASTFHGLVPQIGFDAFGKIMVGMQFVDKKAGTPVMTRLSFMQTHGTFYEYMTERDCPERSTKAVASLAEAILWFPDIDHAKRIYPTLFVIPEMQPKVAQRLREIDSSIARYIIE